VLSVERKSAFVTLAPDKPVERAEPKTYCPNSMATSLNAKDALHRLQANMLVIVP